MQLVDWPGRPAWMERGACIGQNPALWFPPPGNVADGNAAKKVCATCPVQQDCLDYAMTFGPRGLAGIWGGLSERQRVHLHRHNRLLGCG